MRQEWFTLKIPAHEHPHRNLSIGFILSSQTVPAQTLAASRAGQAVQGLAGAALGRLGVAGAQPGRGQVRPRLGEAFFELADLRLQPVLRRSASAAAADG